MSLIRINVYGEVDTSNIDKLLSLLSNYSVSIKSDDTLVEPDLSHKTKRQYKFIKPNECSLMDMLVKVQGLKQSGMNSRDVARKTGYSDSSISVILLVQKVIDAFNNIKHHVKDKKYDDMLEEFNKRLNIKSRERNQITINHIQALRFMITYSHILSVDKRVEILKTLLGYNTPQKETMSADIFLEYIKTIEASMNKIS